MRLIWNSEGFEVIARTRPGGRGTLLRRVRIAAATVSGTVALACASLLTLTASASATPAAQPAQAAAPRYQTISGAGSTWAYNAINDWVDDVHQNGLTVNYAALGSTTGRQEFADGTVVFGASEIPYNVVDGSTTDPAPARGYAYMPDVAGGTVFEYNLKIGNTRVTNLRLSGQVIADIFTGVIQNWDDSRIKADNPDIALPDRQIIPVVRSDGSGATADFTQWMDYLYPSTWKAYCAATGRNPCTPTSSYPQDSADPNMVLQDGDTGVSTYVAQPSSDGAIGYTQFSFALGKDMPVALVENQAGYYTEPTPGHVAVSLLKAQIDYNKSDPLYLTENLAPVFTDSDPRTYELSAYSYLILPTNTYFPMTSNQGYSLGAFGSYLLCQGQQQVDSLGYSALPINLVEAGYDQLSKIPGAVIPSATASFIKGCNNPTFSSNGTNELADTDPYPAACDKAGSTQCNGATGGAQGSGGASGTGSGASGTITSTGGSGSSRTGSGGSSSGGTGGTSGSGGNNGTASGNGASGTNAGAVGATGTNGTTGSGSSCDPNTGVCGSTTGSDGTTADAGTQSGSPVAVSLASSNDNGVEIALMALCGAIFLALCVVPPLAAQASDRRRQRRRAQWVQAADPNEAPGDPR